MLVDDHFSADYQIARKKFLAAAAKRNLSVDSRAHPSLRGAQGEMLTIDSVQLGPPDASELLLITSGIHGVEGFCGSGCQIALLEDDDLLKKIEQAKISVQLIHALNPFGFSYLRRVNEDGIDLNRNFLSFETSVVDDTEYAQIHNFLVPEEWPPSEANELAFKRYVEERGRRQYRSSLSRGQRVRPDGLFYSGTEPSWSNLELRKWLRGSGAGRQRIGWIDIHTGLGQCGHGEKIFTGRSNEADLLMAQTWWGSDVLSPSSEASVTGGVIGPAAYCIFDECPDAKVTSMALEFGTVPFETMLDALRADHWLQKHREVPVHVRETIKRDLLNAFFIDSTEWRAMVLGQFRVAFVQACAALSTRQ